MLTSTEILLLSRPEGIAAVGATIYSLKDGVPDLQPLLQMWVHHSVTRPLAYRTQDIPLSLTLNQVVERLVQRGKASETLKTSLF